MDFLLRTEHTVHTVKYTRPRRVLQALASRRTPPLILCNQPLEPAKHQGVYYLACKEKMQLVSDELQTWRSIALEYLPPTKPSKYETTQLESVRFGPSEGELIMLRPKHYALRTKYIPQLEYCNIWARVTTVLYNHSQTTILVVATIETPSSATNHTVCIEENEYSLPDSVVSKLQEYHKKGIGLDQ